MLQPRRKPAHGRGRAVLRKSGNEASFSELSYQYPLKLLSPEVTAEVPLSIVYILSYGGGLVSGDSIDLQVDVGPQAMILLLTQGSTKVFKSRAAQGVRVSTADMSNTSGTRAFITTQSLSALVHPDALLLLLPDPITCFTSASYSQIQTFRLADQTASAIILDWFTSGRMARGEQWDFERYKSTNEVWIGDRRIARDVMLLEQPSPLDTTTTATEKLNSTRSHSTIPLPTRTLKDRLNPYACYATLFLFGPLVQLIIASLTKSYGTISQMQASKPASLIWSLSHLPQPLGFDAPPPSADEPLEAPAGAIVRVAGIETEQVRNWLKQSLYPLQDIIGNDAYRTAFL